MKVTLMNTTVWRTLIFQQKMILLCIQNLKTSFKACFTTSDSVMILYKFHLILKNLLSAMIFEEYIATIQIIAMDLLIWMVSIRCMYSLINILLSPLYLHFSLKKLDGNNEQVKLIAAKLFLDSRNLRFSSVLFCKVLPRTQATFCRALFCEDSSGCLLRSLF